MFTGRKVDYCHCEFNWLVVPAFGNWLLCEPEVLLVSLDVLDSAVLVSSLGLVRLIYDLFESCEAFLLRGLYLTLALHRLIIRRTQ